MPAAIKLGVGYRGNLLKRSCSANRGDKYWLRFFYSERVACLSSMYISALEQIALSFLCELHSALIRYCLMNLIIYF